MMASVAKTSPSQNRANVSPVRRRSQPLIFILYGAKPKPISSFSPPIASSYLLRFAAGMQAKDAGPFCFHVSLNFAEELQSPGQFWLVRLLTA
jgi:hypothetical protein